VNRILHVASINITALLGWYCGSIEIIRNGNITDATTLSSVQGLPITREWIDASECRDDEEEFSIRSNARCILVIEKEGVYIRLSEDRFFERFPCILVTGKGFPDLATRALVHRLAKKLNIPVCGLCDCNPFGFGVLHTYERGSVRMGVDGGNRYSVPIRWVGLQPSRVQALQGQLPRSVYQRLTDVDKRRLDKLCDECHPFHHDHIDGDVRLDELQLMQSTGYKVELEALNWLGVDYMADWIEDILVNQDSLCEREMVM
jgi:meiotic recombination protein SPO11